MLLVDELESFHAKLATSIAWLATIVDEILPLKSAIESQPTVLSW